MSLRDRLDKHLIALDETHETVIDEYIQDAFAQGVSEEVTWLSNLGVRTATRDPEPTDALEEIRARTVDRVARYDESLRESVFESLDESKGSTYEVIARLFDDGLTVGAGDETHDVKSVSADGSASIVSRAGTVAMTLEPSAYFDWVSAVAVVEARSAGRVAAQLGSDDVMGHVWVDPLDEQTTPMAARLHGETFGRDGLPFHPPVVYGGRSRVWPLFKASSPQAEKLPSVDALVGQRERWFINYSRMQNGELPENDWAHEPVVDEEYNLAFIYTQLLPRDYAQYLPTNE